MEELQELFKVNFFYTFSSVVAILIGVKSIVSLFEWGINKLGIETKWSKRKKEEHDLLIETSRNLSLLQNQHVLDMQHSNNRDDEINKDIHNLTKMFLDKEIDDWRWKILDFSSALSNGRKYNRESFDHIISVYEKYKDVLEENEIKNGYIDESMKFVNEKLQEYLNKGILN